MGFGKWLSKRWGRGPSMKGLRSSVKGTGKFVGTAADEASKVVSFVPGVGRLVAPVLKSGGQLLKGRSIEDSLIAGGKTLAMGELARLGGKAISKLPGADRVTGVLKRVPGVDRLTDNSDVIDELAGGKIPDVSVIGERAARATGGGMADSGRFRSIGDFLGRAGGFLDQHGDDILKYGKAAGTALSAFDKRRRQQRLMRLLEEENKRNAPLRDAARRLLLDESAPDTSSVFNDPLDPNGRYRRVAIGSRVP